MKCDFCNQEFPAEELETIEGARRGWMRTPEEKLSCCKKRNN